MRSNVHPERGEEDEREREREERERREVSSEAVPLEGEKETRVRGRVSDPEERVMSDRLGTSEVAESIVEEIEEEVTAGPSIVKREEVTPVQLTGSLMPVPDVVMVVPDERDTGTLSGIVPRCQIKCERPVWGGDMLIACCECATWNIMASTMKKSSCEESPL